MSTEVPQSLLAGLRTSLFIALGLYFVDAIWLGQGGISLVAVLVVAVFFLPATLWAWYRKNPALRNLRAAKSALYLVMAAAVFITMRLDLNHARHKADTIIAALQAYQAKHGRYPDKLEQLVPDYLPAIPKARLSLTMNTFHYHAAANSHNLSYIVMPPVGFTYYNLETGRWAVKD